MSEESSSKAGKGSSKGQRGLRARLQLVGFEAGKERPDMAVYLLDRSGNVLDAAKVDAEGNFNLSDASLKSASRVVVGPQAEDVGSLEGEQRLVYRAGEFIEMAQKEAVITIPERNWSSWFFFYTCVNGSVSHCRPFPILIQELVSQALLPRLKSPLLESGLTTRKFVFSGLSQQADRLSDAILVRPRIPLPFPFRCETVCHGLVEVYRRTCCRPWLIKDPRLPDLIDRLRGILENLPRQIPEIPFPPRPGPDPGPLKFSPLFMSGALDEMTLNAAQDYEALTSLPEAEQVAYIQARPYLSFFQSCGPAHKVAQGSIHPDGTFSICWREFIRILPFNCYDAYAYVVKQNINGNTVTIYDGVAANKWFSAGQDAELVSYHPKALGCRDNTFPEGGAYTLLEHIGSTSSYLLKTPDATGWDRVAAPAYNDGLAYPASIPSAALGSYLDCNWGGTLGLQYHFSESMKAAGAKYYRISLSAADSSGNPTGSRTYLDTPLSWNKYEVSGTDILVTSTVLGPENPAGGETGLFIIPYDADADWQDNQYHGWLDTTQFVEGRYLITLEVFNAGGHPIRPAGSAGPGTDAPFTFRRWYQPVGPTANVPFSALTHMFWWDNRPSHALIADLRLDGLSSSAQCQFLTGTASSQFSVGYRAYHPEPMFLLNHSLWWRRGLGGPVGYLVNASPYNAGALPGPLAVSPSATFGSMLQDEQKCSFSLNLYVNVKTTNGSGVLDSLDAWDYASFALEQ